MKRLMMACALLVLAVPARADVVTPPVVSTGEWSLMPTTGAFTGPIFYENISWDPGRYYDNNPSFTLSGADGWEYLHAAGDPNAPVGFGWAASPPADLTWELGLTAFTDGVGQFDPSGAITYNVPSWPEMHSSSLDGTQMALARRQIAPDLWMFKALVEDIVKSVLGRGECYIPGHPDWCGDFSDNVATWTWRAPKPPGVIVPTLIEPPVDNPTGRSIPEPASLALWGIALFALTARVKRSFV